MSIQLHIEHLVLDGLPLEAAHGPVVQAAVEAELARLLADRGLGAGFRQGGAVDCARGEDFHLPGRPEPGLLGQRIGAAVHRSLAP